MDEFLLFMQKNWTWMTGAAALIVGVVSIVVVKVKALEKGVQALLRAQMITYYTQYQSAGKTTLYVRQSFENCWEQYEKLGKNGMMSDIHTKFMQFDIEG